MKLALKVDVDTWRGTREGVPRLAELLKQHDAGASFFFSLGPDHTGRAVRRVFRKGFLDKVSRTSVRQHYGLKTLLYGTLLPGPDIGARCADEMRGVRDAGFEVGIHCWDHVRWQDNVAAADAAWTAREMRLAVDRFTEIFGTPPTAHAAAGWQTNIHSLRLTQQLGFDYASDTRGHCPFVPVSRAEVVACPQIPTTLPTLDELIGADGLDPGNVAAHLLELTQPNSGLHAGLSDRAPLHVYTLHAELEGGKLAPVFAELLAGWRRQGYQLVALREVAAALDWKALPRNDAVMEEISGRSGLVAMQGREFLA